MLRILRRFYTGTAFLEAQSGKDAHHSTDNLAANHCGNVKKNVVDAWYGTPRGSFNNLDIKGKILKA